MNISVSVQTQLNEINEHMQKYMNGAVNEDDLTNLIKDTLSTYPDGLTLKIGGGGFNRLVAVDNGNGLGNYVVKIAKNRSGIEDNFRSLLVTDVATKVPMIQEYIAMSYAISNSGHTAIVQEELTVFSPNVNNWVETLVAGPSYSRYTDLIRTLEQYFALADVNIFHTPYNFGYKDGGNLALLDLGDLIPIPTGSVLQCPVCGSPVKYYLPEIEPQLDRFVERATAVDVYTCTNPACKHSVYGAPNDRANILADNGMSYKAAGYWEGINSINFVNKITDIYR